MLGKRIAVISFSLQSLREGTRSSQRIKGKMMRRKEQSTHLGLNADFHPPRLKTCKKPAEESMGLGLIP